MLMSLFYRSYDINDLKNYPLSPIGKRRGSCKVAIIDDEPFVYEDKLRHLGFNLIVFPDVDDVHQLEAYPVIISDIRGVGKGFQSEFGGAFLIQECRKIYPNKAYGVYSGSMQNLQIVSMLRDVMVIKKDESIDNWTTYIDTMINSLSDPVICWKKIRNILLEQDLPLKAVERLESEYVDIILNKKGDFSSFPSRSKKYNVGEDVRAIINSLVAGVILSAL